MDRFLIHRTRRCAMRILPIVVFATMFGGVAVSSAAEPTSIVGAWSREGGAKARLGENVVYTANGSGTSQLTRGVGGPVIVQHNFEWTQQGNAVTVKKDGGAIVLQIEMLDGGKKYKQTSPKGEVVMYERKK